MPAVLAPSSAVESSVSAWPTVFHEQKEKGGKGNKKKKKKVNGKWNAASER